MMHRGKSNSLANVGIRTAPILDRPTGNINKLLRNCSNAQCDSGINSLNSKGTPTGDQNDSLSQGHASIFHSQSIEENITCAIKTFLYSDAVHSVGKKEHFEVKDCNSFVNYVNHLLRGLGSCISATEYFTHNSLNKDQMRRQCITLRWKSETVRRLLQEYEELLKKTGGYGWQISKNSTPNLKSSKNWTSIFKLWDQRRSDRKGAPVPLSTSFLSERIRMHEIEKQIANLSGSIHLKLIDTLVGGNAPTVSSNYKFRLNIAQSETDLLSASRSFLNLYKASESAGRSTTTILNSSPYEWNFTISRKQLRSMNYLIHDPNGLINAQLESQPWRFSSTEGTLLMEPCASLVAAVSADKKKLKKTFDLMQFLTAEPQRITIELTVMSTPSVELEVRWMPFTRLDLAALEQFPVSRTLALDWSSRFGIEESSQNSSNLRRDHKLDDGERDQDGGFASMRLQSSMSYNENSASEISIPYSQPQSFKMSDSYTEDNGRAGDNEGENTCHDADGIANLIESVRNSVDALNRQPHRYRKLLDDLLEVIRGLHEQLSSSGKFTTKSLPKNKSPPKLVDNALENSLSLLDLAIDNTPSNFVSAVESWEAPLSSGWDELDFAIEWHLRNISLLIYQLAVSERICVNPSDAESISTVNTPCVREDLIAMALDSQSVILSDITGLALSYNESKEPMKVILRSHCLANCGISDRGCQGTQSIGSSPLFPMSFWMTLVWKNAPPSIFTSYDSLHHGPINRLSICGDSFQPSLMIERESLQDYILKEYTAVFSKEKDQQVIDTVIDRLIEQIADTDLTDASPSHAIPLTQLCHRLKPQNFKVFSRFDSFKPGSLNNRACSILQRSIQPTDPSIILALDYLIKQEELQRQLRESDDEFLFQSLETLVDGLLPSNGTKDLRTDLMNVSVTNFICLALALQHEDDSVTTYAGRAICCLEECTRLEYGRILQSNQLPFLRTYGPCCTFLKSLSIFNQKTLCAGNRGQSGMEYSGYNRQRTTSSLDGYSLISPVGSAVLNFMQCDDVAEYRLAALSAWECISASAQASIGRSLLGEGQVRGAGKKLGRWMGAEDQGPIQEEVRRMNLSDDNAQVRRQALRILQAQKKFRSTACCLDTPR